MKYMNDERTEELIDETKNRLAKKESLIFKGTSAEWDALTAAEQAQYSVKMITDDETGATVDAVIDGDMRAVTSNAVYDAISHRYTQSKTAPFNLILYPWTVDEDGLLVGSVRNSTGNELVVYVNGIEIARGQGIANTVNAFASIQMPVKKGDVVSFNNVTTGGSYIKLTLLY